MKPGCWLNIASLRRPHRDTPNLGVSFFIDGVDPKGGETVEQVILDPLAIDPWHRERLLEALGDFRKGVAEAPLLRKWSETGNRAATANLGVTDPASPSPASPSPAATESQPKSMAFVLSTDEVDRHGDVIATGGCRSEGAVLFALLVQNFPEFFNRQCSNFHYV